MPHPASGSPKTVTPPPRNDALPPHTPSSRSHSVHIKNVPTPIWAHARHNALLSGLAFRHYVIQLLATSTPLAPPPEPTPPQTGEVA
jgi:hypothetical protein